jgi:hypothetical protein
LPALPAALFLTDNNLIRAFVLEGHLPELRALNVTVVHTSARRASHIMKKFESHHRL